MLVEIENLKIAFQTRTSRFEAVRGVSMKLGTEKLGIVGESGSGKSLTARALMKLLPSNADIRADKLAFDGIDVLSASERQMRQIRGKRAGFILQDPKYSLNPVKTMGAQIAEAWRAHKGGSKRAAMEEFVKGHLQSLRGYRRYTNGPTAKEVAQRLVNFQIDPSADELVVTEVRNDIRRRRGFHSVTNVTDDNGFPHVSMETTNREGYRRRGPTNWADIEFFKD